jgi:hypothetical protein
MLWFILAQCFSTLLELVLLHHQTDRAKDLQILLLPRQLTIVQRKLDKPLRVSRAEKFSLALLAFNLKRSTGQSVRQLSDVIRMVRPATVLKWHRELVKRKWTYRHHSRAGRSRTTKEVECLVLQLARENDWGNGKIEGELLKLGYQISDETVANMLKRYGVPPRSQRRSSLSWRRLMTHYQHPLLACDCFTVETLFLKTLYVFFFIELGTRRVHSAGCTAHPTGAWVTQQARQMMGELDEREPSIRFLIRDNDQKFSHAFDTVFRSAGIHLIPIPYHAPNANAFAEHWIRSVREECLDKLLIINQAHLRHVMREYVAFFNTAHPHPDLAQQIPIPPANKETSGPVRCRHVLDGVIPDDYRDAA